MAEAVEKAVDEVMRRHHDPCADAKRRGVPCFPTGIEMEGPRYSVADAMRKYRPQGGRPENAPITAGDMQDQMSGRPLSATGSVSVDPFCTAKSLIRRMSGNGKFYLYELSDGREARPVLTDRKIDMRVHASNPEAVYQYLGEYSGECEAIAAWRKHLRESVAPPPVDSSADPAAVDGASPAKVPPAASSPDADEITIEDRPRRDSPPPGPPPPGGPPPP
jgi:hypothetical protein